MSTQSNRLLADYFNLAEASYADFSQSRKGATYNKKAAREAMIKKKDVGGAEQPESLADLVLDNPAQPTSRTPSQTPPRASASVGVFGYFAPPIGSIKMFMIAILFFLGLWVLGTILFMVLGWKAKRHFGLFVGFMLPMGNFIVYWTVEYWMLQAKVTHLCETRGGTKIYLTPEEYRKKIGEE